MQLVSIIMSVKNAVEFLGECIDSIVNQTYKNWELIAVNDNSTDDTLEKLTLFSQQEPRINVVNNHGNGIIDALQTGYKIAKGEFITRMDADDVMSTTKLELLNGLLIKSGKGFVATGMVKYFSKKELGNGYKNYENWLNELCINNANFDEIYKECSIPSPCWMLWREDFDKCGGFESNIYPEDYDLAFRMYKNDLKVIGSSQILHHWRDSENRASRTDDNYKDNRFLALKITYFIDIDYDKNKELILWGAGKKGKEIAQLLNKKEITYRWICNSKTKIGHKIYNVTMEDSDTSDLENKQIIIAVANKEEQIEIQKTVTQFKNAKSYYFC